MKTILLLNDQVSGPRCLLQTTLPNVRVPETEAVAGGNCDRWGHPCPEYLKRTVKTVAQLPILEPTKN